MSFAEYRRVAELEARLVQCEARLATAEMTIAELMTQVTELDVRLDQRVTQMRAAPVATAMSRRS